MITLSPEVQPEKGWNLPFDASVDGHRIDWLIQITGVFVLIMFVIMCVWMLYASLKHREGHTADYDHGNSRHSIKVALIVSSIIFFVVDGNLWVNSTIDVNTRFWNHAYAEKQPNAVRIEVNAHQWAWDARYHGPDGKFNTADDVVVTNDIRVPVDAPILLQLASVDVIHSFYLPNFRTKMDATPGMVNRFWFQAKKTGAFDIGCAQHCGANHYKMKGKLIVMPREEFDAWLAAASAVAQKGYDPAAADANWGWDWKDTK
jgi:cytochrome c oxidase subunit 2